MRIIPIINRLKSEVVLFSNRVEPAQSLTALQDSEINNDLPIGFVYTVEEVSSSSDTATGASQEARKQFAVMIAAKNIDVSLGEEYLEDAREQVKTALLGWQPSADHAPISYDHGKIIDTSKRLVWWADYYSTWALDEGGL